MFKGFFYQLLKLLCVETHYVRHNLGYLVSVVMSFAIVVFIAASMFAIRDGVNTTVEGSKHPNLLFAVDRRADSELISRLSKQDKVSLNAAIAEYEPSFSGLLAEEFAALVNLPLGDVTLRGVSSESFLIEPRVNIVKGRRFNPSQNEVIVGARLLRLSDTLTLGGKIILNDTEWVIVGIFESPVALKESEIWADIRQVHDSYEIHEIYSVFVFNLANEQRASDLLSGNKDTAYKVVSSDTFYTGSGKHLVNFIDFIGRGLSVITMFGVVIGIASICYSQLLSRHNDLKVSYVIGFGSSIRWAFIISSTLQALIGSILGLFAAFIVTRNMTLSTFDAGKQLVFDVSLSTDTLLTISLSCLFTAWVANIIVAHKALCFDKLR